eukprot:3010156-Prymnesium_polylepis.1
MACLTLEQISRVKGGAGTETWGVRTPGIGTAGEVLARPRLDSLAKGGRAETSLTFSRTSRDVAHAKRRHVVRR